VRCTATIPDSEVTAQAAQLAREQASTLTALNRKTRAGVVPSRPEPTPDHNRGWQSEAVAASVVRSLVEDVAALQHCSEQKANIVEEETGLKALLD